VGEARVKKLEKKKNRRGKDRFGRRGWKSAFKCAGENRQEGGIYCNASDIEVLGQTEEKSESGKRSPGGYTRRKRISTTHSPSKIRRKQ